jgi:hypothetical protein
MTACLFKNLSVLGYLACLQRAQGPTESPSQGELVAAQPIRHRSACPPGLSGTDSEGAECRPSPALCRSLPLIFEAPQRSALGVPFQGLR